jgi:ABC-type glycerol-3-phosphate transport system substrate-binding protein
MNAKGIVIGLLLFVYLLFAQFLPTPVYAAQAPLSAKQQALIDLARKEGVFDIIATWRPNEAKAIFGAFKEAYPFVEVKQTMMAGAVGFERLRAEFASGRRTTDLINTSIGDLEKAGMVQAWQAGSRFFRRQRKRPFIPL